MADLDSFPLFPALPTELRLRIWELTIEPRIVREGCNFPSMYMPLVTVHLLLSKAYDAQQNLLINSRLLYSGRAVNLA